MIFIYCSSPNIHAGANSTRPVIVITRARTMNVVSTRYLPRFLSFYFYTSVLAHLVQSLNSSNLTPTFILPLSGCPDKSIVLLQVTEALVVTQPEQNISIINKYLIPLHRPLLLLNFRKNWRLYDVGPIFPGLAGRYRTPPFPVEYAPQRSPVVL